MYIHIIKYIHTSLQRLILFLGHGGTGKSSSVSIAGMLPELLFHLRCKPTAGAGRLWVTSLSRRNYRKGSTVHDTLLLYQTKPVWLVRIEVPVAKPSVLVQFEGGPDGLTGLVSEFDFDTERNPPELDSFITFFSGCIPGPWLTAWLPRFT